MRHILNAGVKVAGRWHLPTARASANGKSQLRHVTRTQQRSKLQTHRALLRAYGKSQHRRVTIPQQRSMLQTHRAMRYNNRSGATKESEDRGLSALSCASSILFVTLLPASLQASYLPSPHRGPLHFCAGQGGDPFPHSHRGPLHFRCAGQGAEPLSYPAPCRTRK